MGILSLILVAYALFLYYFNPIVSMRTSLFGYLLIAGFISLILAVVFGSIKSIAPLKVYGQSKSKWQFIAALSVVFILSAVFILPTFHDEKIVPLPASAGKLFGISNNLTLPDSRILNDPARSSSGNSLEVMSYHQRAPDWVQIGSQMINVTPGKQYIIVVNFAYNNTDQSGFTMQIYKPNWQPSMGWTNSEQIAQAVTGRVGTSGFSHAEQEITIPQGYTGMKLWIDCGWELHPGIPSIVYVSDVHVYEVIQPSY